MIRFGVIGTNTITEQFLSAAALCKNFVLTTVYSRKLATAQTFAQKWGAKFAVDSLDTLAQSDEVDAVYVASPNLFHVPQTLLLLENGKHVLCEKPIAPDSAQLEEMLLQSQKSGVVLLEAMRSAHLPSLSAMRNAMLKIGRVHRAQIGYCQYSSRYDSFRNGIMENAFDPTLCNGSLMDIGVYCVHLMVMLFGTPQDIVAKGSFLPGSIDAYGDAICSYKDMQVQLSYSKVFCSNSPGEIQGEDGTVYFSPAAKATSVWIEYRDGTREDIPFFSEPQDMLYELEAFLRLIETKESPAKWQSYSVQATGILDEMRRQIGIDFLPH